MRAKWLVPILIGTSGFFASMVGLATNVASADTKWPGFLDYVREHPWWVLLISVASSAIIGIALDALSTDGNSGEQESQTLGGEPRQSIDLRGSTFNSSVNFTQEINPSEPGPERDVDFEQNSGSGPSSREGPRNIVILYTLSAFLDSAKWEEVIFKTVEEFGQNYMCVQLEEQGAPIPNIAVVVIAFSNAQHAGVKSWIRKKLREAKSSNPSTRVVMAALGFAEEPVQEKELRQMLRRMEYPDQQVKILICETEDKLANLLSSHINVAVRVRENHSRMTGIWQGSLGDGGSHEESE